MVAIFIFYLPCIPNAVVRHNVGIVLIRARFMRLLLSVIFFNQHPCISNMSARCREDAACEQFWQKHHHRDNAPAF
jgi:hypothetical protein